MTTIQTSAFDLDEYPDRTEGLLGDRRRQLKERRWRRRPTPLTQVMNCRDRARRKLARATTEGQRRLLHQLIELYGRELARLHGSTQ
jgi:hypothetical protein